MDDAAANEIEQCFKEGETERALRRVVELDTRREELSDGLCSPKLSLAIKRQSGDCLSTYKQNGTCRL